ncbi:MAG: AzlC family ABC transporter permease [Lachnospiraceae bacterium]|nr:AzlC family ABC transporter permease [Lachnospiraceae bacterium]
MTTLTADNRPGTAKLHIFMEGLRDGIPICLGYFAVSFALGIAARETGISAPLSFLMSAGMVASAGEFAALLLIGQGAGVIEMILTTLTVNLRYFLMSCALSQKTDPKLPFGHRMGLAYCITDELFALAVAKPAPIEPVYSYGATLISVSGWCAGTVLGVLAGQILPDPVYNALSVALYGMFLAIIIPPAKKDRFLAVLIIVCMAASTAFSVLPVISGLSDGFKVTILTILFSAIAATLRPVDEGSGREDD